MKMLGDWGLVLLAVALAVSIILADWTGRGTEAAILWVAIAILQLCREVRDIAAKIK